MRALAALALALLLGCSGGGPAEKVAARVNGTPITVRAVNAQRDAAPGRSAKQALEALIDRRLLLERALAQGLDRAPGVQAAIAAARDKILVQAYLEKLADAHYRYDPAAVGRFYREHPALFAERRVYRFFELAASGSPGDLERLKAKARQAKTVYEVATWLEAQGVAFKLGAATKPAEEIPLAMLPALAALHDGEMAALPVPGGVSVVQLVHAERQPIGEAQAEPRIRRHFWLRAGGEALPQELQWLRAKARIEYVAAGDYRELQPPQPAAAGAIEVIEFFWYRCPHCYALEPAFERWAAALPRDVQVRRVPVVFDAEWAIDAGIFYALQALGEEARLRRPLYDAIHREGGRRLDRERYRQWIEDWLSRHGIDRARLRAALDSKAVRAKVEQAKRMTVAYGVEGTPSLAVAGRYVVDAQADSEARMLETASKLVEIVREERTPRG